MRYVIFLGALVALHAYAGQNYSPPFGREQVSCDSAVKDPLGMISERSPVKDEQATLMDARHPYSVMTCLSSKASRSKPIQACGKTLEPFEGTDHGHLFVYLHGVCVDRSGPYEKLASCVSLPTCGTAGANPLACAPNVPMWDQEYGTMVGVDTWHRNRAFLAVQGWSMAMEGPKGGTDEMIKQIIDQKVLKGVDGAMPHRVKNEFGQWDMKFGPPMSECEKAAATIGTITAIRRFRNLTCHKEYVQDSGDMDKIIDAYNNRNERFEKGRKDFEYDGDSNNCVVNSRVARRALDEDVYESSAREKEGIAAANKMYCDYLYGDPLTHAINGALIGKKEIMNGFKAGVDCDQAIYHGLAEPARDFKHDQIVSARPIPDPIHAFFNPTAFKTLSHENPGFPPQVAYDLSMPQLDGSAYAAERSPGIPAPMNNPLFKDSEHLDPNDVHLDAMDAARTKLDQYEKQFAALGGVLSAGKCSVKMKASDFEGQRFKTDFGQELTWHDETGYFAKFYAGYVKALCSELAKLREDVKVMAQVNTRVPCVANSGGAQKGATSSGSGIRGGTALGVPAF